VGGERRQEGGAVDRQAGRFDLVSQGRFDQAVVAIGKMMEESGIL
jgi:hypothetical protein